MIAIELIELGAVVGAVLWSIPPTPVAAFGDQDFFEGQPPHFGGYVPASSYAPPRVEQILHARLSSSAPIQMSKFALIQEPGTTLLSEKSRIETFQRLGDCVASRLGSSEMRAYNSPQNGRPFDSNHSHAFSPSRMIGTSMSRPCVLLRIWQKKMFGRVRRGHVLILKTNQIAQKNVSRNKVEFPGCSGTSDKSDTSSSTPACVFSVRPRTPLSLAAHLQPQSAARLRPHPISILQMATILPARLPTSAAYRIGRGSVVRARPRDK